MYATLSGYSQEIQTLLANGADIHTIDNIGLTALMVASQIQTKEIVELLLKNGADPNQKSEKSPAILELAKSNEHVGVIAILKQYGAK